MKITVTTIAVCCCWIAAQAKPGYYGWENQQLQGIPDVSDYDKLIYPQYQLQELGSESHGDIPPKTIKVIKTITVKVPQPYPVKVPHKVPYPVPVEKPYPIVQTKLVHVPHPVPVEVIKKVPVPVEVPKPYPVPKEEFLEQQYNAGGGGYGGSYYGGLSYTGDSNGGYQQIVTAYGIPAQNGGENAGGYSTYENNQESYQVQGAERQGFGGQYQGHGQEDQSAGYAAFVGNQEQAAEYREEDNEKERDNSE